MTADIYLVDTSVLARVRQSVVGERLSTLGGEGRLGTCGLVDLEVMFGSRAGDVAVVAAERRELPRAGIDDRVLNRAAQVAALLAAAGTHRGAKPVDLVVAAAAEGAGWTVLHYDGDYDRIASVTGQSTEWVAPPGTLDR